MGASKVKISSLAEGETAGRVMNGSVSTTKMKQLEADIALLENNIGFFSKSKKCGRGMIREVNNKITKAKEEMASLIEKDRFDRQTE